MIKAVLLCGLRKKTPDWPKPATGRQSVYAHRSAISATATTTADVDNIRSNGCCVYPAIDAVSKLFCFSGISTSDNYVQSVLSNCRSTVIYFVSTSICFVFVSSESSATTDDYTFSNSIGTTVSSKWHVFESVIESNDLCRYKYHAWLISTASWSSNVESNKRKFTRLF